VCGLLKDRAQTLNEIADLAVMFYAEPHVHADQLAEHVRPRRGRRCAPSPTPAGRSPGRGEDIQAAIRRAVAEHGVKMPQFGIPARLLVFGRTQTPALDAVLVLMPREVVSAGSGGPGARAVGRCRLGARLATPARAYSIVSFCCATTFL